jgi:tellurite resistance protein TehA-like permease
MGKKGSYGALAAGFILALVGFVVILYEVWTTATIPLNDYTYLGVALAGVGIALGAVGIDRGIDVKG